MDAKYLTPAETAKLIRNAVKKAFPKVKFGVRTRTYSMGASIDVSWTDGPTAQDVSAVVGNYQGSGFDGMTDSSYSVYSWLKADGSASVAEVSYNKISN